MVIDLEYRKYFAALHWACTGTKMLESLLARFGLPINAWRTSGQNLYQLPGWKREDVDAFVTRRAGLDVEGHWGYLERAEIQIIFPQEQEYPENLRYIYDPPRVLYVKGSPAVFRREAVAVVGTRKASPYGKLVAEQLAQDLAGRGLLVVSGLARGIDSAAHKGALSSGSTVAVLGCGPDVVYPRENRRLWDEITNQGAVISEYPPGTPPNSWNFPARNRIISGLSLGVAVVEAEEKSGSLITVDCALDQGREVFAVPGNIFAANSKGPHKLLKQGAKLVTCTEDILEELALDTLFPRTAHHSVQESPGLTPAEVQILQFLDVEPMSLDVLVRKSGLAAGQLLSILTFLEIKGLVKQLPGQNFLRVKTF